MRIDESAPTTAGDRGDALALRGRYARLFCRFIHS